MYTQFSIHTDGVDYTVLHTQFLSGIERVEVVGSDSISVAYATIDHDTEHVEILYAGKNGHPESRGEYSFNNLCRLMECEHHELVDLAKWLVATHPVNG